MSARLSAERRQLLEQVAGEVPNHPDCVRVAVVGVDGVGKTVFADRLGAQLREGGREVVRVSADAFHHARTVRYRRGRTSPEGFWLDSYDLASMRERVPEPLGPGGNRRYQPAAHDVANVRDGLVQPAAEATGTSAVRDPSPGTRTARGMSVRNLGPGRTW